MLNLMQTTDPINYPIDKLNWVINLLLLMLLIKLINHMNHIG